MTMETYHGHVRTPLDAIILFEACRRGILPRVQRRLSEKERHAIVSGSVFVWDEREAGMRRWTDGKSWSASRVSGSFLTYREMEGKRSEPTQDEPGNTSSSNTNGSVNQQDSPGDDPLSDGYRYKPDGLMKQSFSIQTTNNLKLHLISYFSRSHVTSNKLIQPSMDPNLKNIPIPNGLYPDASSPFEGPSHPLLPIHAHVVAVAAAAGLGHQMLGGPRPPPPQGYPVQVPPQYHHQSPYPIQQNLAPRQPEGPPPPQLPYYNMDSMLHSRSQHPSYPYPTPPLQQQQQSAPHQQPLHQQPPPPLQQQPSQSLPSQTTLRQLPPVTTEASPAPSLITNSPVTNVKLNTRKASPLAPMPSKVQKASTIAKSPRLKLPPPSSFLKDSQIASTLAGQPGLLLQQNQQRQNSGVAAPGQSIAQSVLSNNAPTGGEDGKRLPGLSSFSVQDIPYEKVTWGEDVRAIQVLDKGFSL